MCIRDRMVREFFYAVSYSAAMHLHIKVLTPGNNHHMIEAMFKAFAKALDDACTYDSRIKAVSYTHLSTAILILSVQRGS